MNPEAKIDDVLKKLSHAKTDMEEAAKLTKIDLSVTTSVEDIVGFHIVNLLTRTSLNSTEVTLLRSLLDYNLGFNS